MRVSFMGILIVVLAVVGLWHLFSTGGKRAASVWFFFSQVALVLGALMLIGLLFGGVTHRLSYDHRHAAQSQEECGGSESPTGGGRSQGPQEAWHGYPDSDRQTLGPPQPVAYSRCARPSRIGGRR